MHRGAGVCDGGRRERKGRSARAADIDPDAQTSPSGAKAASNRAPRTCLAASQSSVARALRYLALGRPKGHSDSRQRLGRGSGMRSFAHAVWEVRRRVSRGLLLFRAPLSAPHDALCCRSVCRVRNTPRCVENWCMGPAFLDSAHPLCIVKSCSRALVVRGSVRCHVW